MIMTMMMMMMMMISPGVRLTSLTDPGQEGERGGRRPLLSGGSSPQGGHISRGGPALRPLMATDVEPGEKLGIMHSAIKGTWEFSCIFKDIAKFWLNSSFFCLLNQCIATF